MARLIPFNNPFNRSSNFSMENFDNVVDDFFHNMWYPTRNLINDTFKLDIKELDDNYLIEAEMPGISKDEVSLALNDGKLTISINKNSSVDKEEENYIHRERQTSSVQRSVYLADADSNNIKAKLENGLLKITVPKLKPNSKTTNINIE